MDIASRISHTCCFLGHREICTMEDLTARLRQTIEELIVQKDVDTFLFGSKSAFNSLCYRLVTEIKHKFPHIKRVYMRAEYPLIDDGYTAYLLERYEGTCYPESIMGAGRLVYIKRNQQMIDHSQFCIFYIREDYMPKDRKSGTKIVFDYAQKYKKTIFKFPGCPQ